MSKDNREFNSKLADLTSKHATIEAFASGEIDGVLLSLAEALGKTIAFCGMGDPALTNDLLEGTLNVVTEVAADHQHVGALVAKAVGYQPRRPN